MLLLKINLPMEKKKKNGVFTFGTGLLHSIVSVWGLIMEVNGASALEGLKAKSWGHIFVKAINIWSES